MHVPRNASKGGTCFVVAKAGDFPVHEAESRPEFHGCAGFESSPVSKRCSLLQKVALRLKSKYMLEIFGEQRKSRA